MSRPSVPRHIDPNKTTVIKTKDGQTVIMPFGERRLRITSDDEPARYAVVIKRLHASGWEMDPIFQRKLVFFALRRLDPQNRPSPPTRPLLSDREWDVYIGVAWLLETSRQIGDRLGTSPRSIGAVRTRIRRKLGIRRGEPITLDALHRIVQLQHQFDPGSTPTGISDPEVD